MVESYGRNVAQNTNRKIKTITGQLQQLKLMDPKKKKKVQIYLHDKKVPIPKMIYKLYMDVEAGKATGFFISNDSAMSTTDVKQFRSMCNDICGEIGLQFSDEISKGLTICCSAQDFYKNVNFVPKLIPATARLLKGAGKTPAG